MEEGNPPKLGAAIIYARKKAGLSQRKLAQKLGCHQAQISYWETEKAGYRISAPTFVRVAKALGYEPHLLLKLAERLAEVDLEETPA